MAQRKPSGVKSVSDEELAELLAAAARPAPPTTREDTLPEIDRFIASIGMKQGEARISPSIIIRRYWEWTKDPMDKKKFFVELKKRFKQRRFNGNRYFSLDPAPFDMSPENVARGKRDMTKTNAARDAYWAKKKAEENDNEEK